MKVRPHVGTALAAHSADETRLEIGPSDVVIIIVETFAAEGDKEVAQSAEAGGGRISGLVAL